MHSHLQSSAPFIVGLPRVQLSFSSYCNKASNFECVFGFHFCFELFNCNCIWPKKKKKNHATAAILSYSKRRIEISVKNLNVKEFSCTAFTGQFNQTPFIAFNRFSLTRQVSAASVYLSFWFKDSAPCRVSDNISNTLSLSYLSDRPKTYGDAPQIYHRDRFRSSLVTYRGKAQLIRSSCLGFMSNLPSKPLPDSTLPVGEQMQLFDSDGRANSPSSNWETLTLKMGIPPSLAQKIH